MLSSRRLGSAGLALLCVSIGVAASTAPALALDAHTFSGSFGSPGPADGQLAEPQGVAVNDTTHDVYVADKGNKRVEEFTSAGAYVGQFAPPTGFGASYDPGPLQLAVDNSGNPLDPSAGDVYVVDRPNKVIDKFSETGVYEGHLDSGEAGAPFGQLYGVAVEPNGTVWVSEQTNLDGSDAQSFTDAEINAFRSKVKLIFAPLEGLTADSEGRIYVNRSGGARQIIPSSKGDREFDEGEQVSGLAVDTESNIVYLGAGEHVSAYDSRLVLRERFGSGHLSASGGVGVDSSTGTVYVSDSATGQIVVFGQVVLPDVSTGEKLADERHEGSVTLDGTVNPDGLPVTSCVFEYGTDASYGATVPCEPSPGSGSGEVAVHADVSALTPLTEYHYRLVATNANGSTPGIDRSFVAPTRPAVSGESVFDVSSGSATLSGRVDPGGAETTYRFEYGPSSSYGESVSGNAGSGTGEVEVSAHPQDLSPGTSYHYRLVAESQLATVAGEDHVFVTERGAGGSGLPDGRAWELVSPPNKQGASLNAPGGEDITEAAVDGGAIAYAASGPVEVNPEGNRAPEGVQVFSARRSGGWSSRVIATPHDATHQSDALGRAEYAMFSSDLSLSLVEPVGPTPLSAETTEPTPYLRHDTECEARAASCFQPLVTAVNVASGTKFGTGETNGFDSEVAVAGATQDLSHVLLVSNVALTSGGTRGLYEWVGGHLAFVVNMELGYHGWFVRHAVSDDGSRVIGTTGPQGGAKELLMRDIPAGRTVRLDAAEPGAAGGESEPVFQTASSDGSRVFFTDTARLTTDSTAATGTATNMPDLYEFDVETGTLSDLTVPLHAGEHADVLGQVIGASEDGSYVYFVANGVLANGGVQGDCGAEGGNLAEESCNLYMRHGATTTFIARLSGEDKHSYAERLDGMAARVSPDGQWLAFMSSRSLTRYDNRDVATGKPDQEVFLYHASTGRVVCASCEPTGARPAGQFESEKLHVGEATPLVNKSSTWDNIDLAAAVPTWANRSLNQTVYQSRYLSDSGRLFFDSYDALVPQDGDGTWDVYEYEPPGVGDCVSGSVAFSEASGGCVGLISSGGGREESLFLDASENGDEVFFMTGAGLLSQDYDGASDIYDARVCNASSPCLPVAPVTPPPCSTGDSCKSAPSPQPAVFGEPSSQTFSGAGNITPGGEGKGVSSRSLTRAQKLANALRACHKKRRGRKRATCERRARKRYGKAAKAAAGKGLSGRTGR